MPDESGYTLYSEAPITLVAVPATANLDDFFEDLIARSPAQANGAAYSFARLGSGQVFRVTRRFAGNPVSIHCWINVRTAANGTRTLRLQPLSGWQPSFGGGNSVQPLLASDAAAHIAAMRGDLPQIAGQP